ncbi:hypothetical protein CB0940_04190 [Cercospora beticola]|uniref:Uncharacterized protein n=1 Tax=Cercospora beticola TaxID=122368 RepID=A0A2G5HKN2_CERBT|nr:hypothetical protein CB0940_04190 [Cercospora beticola]PIA93098.1 hypothetical protein CB0940_04190 [Cercospora beticola]WPB01407.1 hypothetical protein RHO25_006033 [Cercospora beticola]
MARVRAAPGSQAPTKATATRQALKEKTNTARTNGPVYEDDGNTDGLIKDSQPKRGRPKRVARQDSDELVMAGGLGLASGESAKKSDAPTTTDELAKSDAAPMTTAKPNRRPARTIRKVATSQTQNEVLNGLKQRMNAAAKSQRTKQRPEAQVVRDTFSDPKPSDALPTNPAIASESQDAIVDRSELSLSSSPPARANPGTAQKHRSSIMQPGSVLRAQNTPAVESSMLALKNFKRRPRQPSMLQMVRQKVGSARPSLANDTAVTVDDNAVEDTSVFDLDISDDNEDFAPEAEGTPLHLNQNRLSNLGSVRQRSTMQLSLVDNSAVQPQKKRKSDTLDVSSGSLSGSRSKKPRQDQDVSSGSLSALHARRQQPVVEVAQAPEADDDDCIVVRSSTDRDETPQPATTSDVQVINSPSSSTPPTEPSSSHHRRSLSGKDDDYAVPSTAPDAELELATRHVDPQEEQDDIVNGTMADPVSSPGAPSEDVMADPATQRASPSPVKKKPRGKPKPINTAALQSLLPKRRQPLRPRKRKSEYDIESSEAEDDAVVDTSHLDEDEDELGVQGKRRAKPAPTKTKRGTTAKRGKSGKAAPTASKKTAAKKSTKTYGRATVSDKENDGHESFEEAEESTLPEIPHSMQDVAKSKELEAAKAKFADIDQWDMEFETMSADDHRSSSLNWR